MSKYKGVRMRVTVRIPLRLYFKLQDKRKGMSLNDYIVKQLEKGK